MPYRIGDWCAVPLDSGGWAPGLIARAGVDSVAAKIVGYFFGPRFDKPPRLVDTRELRPEDAILVKRTTDQGLRGGTWRTIGRDDAFVREEWPMPVFGRCELEELGGRCWRVYYDEDDPANWLRDEPADKDEVVELPADGSAGDLWVQTTLDRLLGGNPRHEVVPSGIDTQFFLAFPSRRNVKAAAADFEAEGFRTVDIFQAEINEWSLIVAKEIPDTDALDLLDEPGGLIERIAQAARGTYAGYERPV